MRTGRRRPDQAELIRRQAAPCVVENRLKLLMYPRIHCAFSPVFASHGIHLSDESVECRLRSGLPTTGSLSILVT